MAREFVFPCPSPRNMDTKTLALLEYPKILARLAAHCDFSASAELAQALTPTADYNLAKQRQQETSEARWLIAAQDPHIGGARDMRPQVELARRGGVLEAQDLLDIKTTLIACRELKKNLEKNSARAPRLAEIALELPLPGGVVDAISRVLSDKGEVLDSASPKLAALRRELKTSHERLMSRLQKYISDPHSVAMLQDALITQRDGRYVIPLRAEFKGQIKSIVHDQSASGATLFVEPLAVVELNNSYRETQIAERNEILRVLGEVSLQVGLAAAEIIPGIAALAELDLAFAKAKYAEEVRASEPLLQNTSQVIKLYRARHPLLDPASAVANDIDLAPGTRAVVITGPNTGGKTVALKTIGLLALMAQSGLQIPAQSGSEISLFDDILADIGDEQSIEQSLSTFSGHITNIIRILKKIDARALVIFDELGAGTDPQEGAALARAILQQLLASGCTVFVATHYPELKNFAHSAEGVVNASLEFDVTTLRPTYRLTLGLPGRSNALAIAARLGLPEAIIAAAKNAVDPENLRADKLLDDIRKERNRASREREKGEKARSRAETVNRELAARLEKIEEERRAVLAQARAEAELEVAVLKRNLGRLKAEMKKLRQPLDALEKLEIKVAALEEKTAAPIARQAPPVEKAPSGELKLGEKVILHALGSEGVVTSLGENEAEVQIGALRIRARLSEIRRKSAEAEPPEQAKTQKRKAEISESRPAPLSQRSSPGLEIDLRGQRAEDALQLLETYLDQAYLSGLPFVRIIHGKGTGKLRQEVRAALKTHPQVATFEEGLPSEGGDGVTVAKLVKD